MRSRPILVAMAAAGLIGLGPLLTRGGDSSGESRTASPGSTQSVTRQARAALEGPDDALSRSQADRAGATPSVDARAHRILSASDASLRFAPVVESEAWARRAFWSRGAAVVVLPGRFAVGTPPRISAQVVDETGDVIDDRAVCPVVPISETEIVVALPTGPRKGGGKVRVRYVEDGRTEGTLVEIPLPYLHESIAHAERMVRHMIGFPGDSAVHRGFQARLRAGDDRRKALVAAEEQVRTIGALLLDEPVVSRPLSARLRRVIERLRDESLAEIGRRLAAPR